MYMVGDDLWSSGMAHADTPVTTHISKGWKGDEQQCEKYQYRQDPMVKNCRKTRGCSVPGY